MHRRRETLPDVRREMDAFSEVLSGVRLKGAMFFSAEFSAPWRLSTPHCRLLTPTLSPGAPHLLIYHFVVEGSARAGLEGGPDVELSAGDIVVFPHGDPHRLSAGSGATDIEILSGLNEGDQIVTGSFKVIRTLRNQARIKVDNGATKVEG